jgi:hypothetical protein
MATWEAGLGNATTRQEHTFPTLIPEQSARVFGLVDGVMARLSWMDTGLSLDDFCVLFLTLGFIVTFFPQAPRPEPVAMN